MPLVKYAALVLPVALEDVQKALKYSQARYFILEPRNNFRITVKCSEESDLNGVTGEKYERVIHTPMDRVPKSIVHLLPDGVADMFEVAIDAFPHFTSNINSVALPKRFKVRVDTVYVSGAPYSSEAHNNPANLSPEDLAMAMKNKTWLNIAELDKTHGDYDEETDPSLNDFTGHGPLKGEWWESYDGAVTTVYRFIHIEAKAFGLGALVERSSYKEMVGGLVTMAAALTKYKSKWDSMTQAEVEAWVDKVENDSLKKKPGELGRDMSFTRVLSQGSDPNNPENTIAAFVRRSSGSSSMKSLSPVTSASSSAKSLPAVAAPRAD